MPTHTIASTVAGEAADARGAGRAAAASTSAVEIARLGRTILFMVGVFHAVCSAVSGPHRMSSVQPLLDRVTARGAGDARH